MSGYERTDSATEELREHVDDAGDAVKREADDAKGAASAADDAREGAKSVGDRVSDGDEDVIPSDATATATNHQARLGAELARQGSTRGWDRVILAQRSKSC